MLRLNHNESKNTVNIFFIINDLVVSNEKIDNCMENRKKRITSIPKKIGYNIYIFNKLDHLYLKY